jgi:hypothetical protein
VWAQTAERGRGGGAHVLGGMRTAEGEGGGVHGSAEGAHGLGGHARQGARMVGGSYGSREWG